MEFAYVSNGSPRPYLLLIEQSPSDVDIEFDPTEKRDIVVLLSLGLLRVSSYVNANVFSMRSTVVSLAKLNAT